MRYLTVDFKGDEAFLLPIGDIHVGDKAFGAVGRRKLEGYLNWARDHENKCRIFLLGDIFNVATRGSRTPPWESDPNEYRQAIDIFRPYQDLIIGAVDGNHENRARDFMGFSPLESLCRELGAAYCGWSAVLKIRVGHRGHNRYRQTYFGYVHHTTGGGSTLGAALKRVEKLSDIVRGCDIYMGGHNHQLTTGVRDIYEPSMQANKCVLKRVHFVSCGSYLDWDGSYAEQGMYAPSKLGSPKIMLSGGKKPDVHVSI